MTARPNLGRFIHLTILAGMAWLGLDRPARADLIFQNLNVTLNAANIESYNLDVDRNGTTDFTFTAAFVPDPILSVGFDTVDFRFGSNNALVIDALTGDGFPSASLLQVGNTVSAASLFSGPNDQGNLFFYVSIDSPPTSGNFGGQTGYVGLRFDGPGGLYNGFAQVTVKGLNDPTNPFDLTIGTVAFNDTPGQAATVTVVPEPASLLLFGSGMALLVARRRRGAVPRAGGE